MLHDRHDTENLCDGVQTKVFFPRNLTIRATSGITSEATCGAPSKSVGKRKLLKPACLATRATAAPSNTACSRRQAIVPDRAVRTGRTDEDPNTPWSSAGTLYARAPRLSQLLSGADGESGLGAVFTYPASPHGIFVCCPMDSDHGFGVRRH
jgi:hypothetical protein